MIGPDTIQPIPCVDTCRSLASHAFNGSVNHEIFLRVDGCSVLQITKIPRTNHLALISRKARNLLLLEIIAINYLLRFCWPVESVVPAVEPQT